MKQIMIEKLQTGWKVSIDEIVYTVTGATKLRGKVLYLLKDDQGKQHSLDQKRLLEGQRENWLQVLG